jgi:probable F420-dependent oxidoreductase
MRFGIAIPTWGPFGDVHAAFEVIRCVEDLGFESAWFADHVAIPTYATDRFAPPFLEPLSLAGWTLARHSRLKVGTDVLVAPYRHPILLAAMAGSLDRLSDGRLTLGMGIGYLQGEFSALGVPVGRRGPMTDEVLSVLRTLWSDGGPRAFAGSHYEFEDIVPAASPLHGVPLWVGGNNPNARQRAALLGDGWHPLHPSPAEYAQGRAEIEARRIRERLSGDFTFSFSSQICHLTTDSGPSDLPRAIPSTAVRPEYRYAPANPTDSKGRPLLSGSPEHVLVDINAYEEAGVDHMVLRVWNSSSQLDLIGVINRLTQIAELLGL